MGVQGELTVDISVAPEQGSEKCRIRAKAEGGLLKLGACLESGGRALDDADRHKNKNIPS